jgi:peptidoglycan/LPS O-acetylase OafA/YrhL
MVFAGSLYLASALSRLTGADRDRCRMVGLMLLSIIGAAWPLGLAPYLNLVFFPHFNNFMLGAAACLLLFRFPWSTCLSVIVVGSFVGGLIIAYSSFSLASLLSFSFLLAPAFMMPARRLLSSAPLQILGRWSYASYLLHPLIGALLIEMLQHHLPAGPLLQLVYVVIGVCVTCGLSHIFWLLVERPSIYLSKSIQIAACAAPCPTARRARQAGHSA